MPDQEEARMLFRQIALENNEAAFAQLFRHYYARLHRFALQFVDKPEVAEETVNDIFLKLWRYRAHLHTVDHPESYLFIGVRNQALNYVKQYSKVKVSEAGSLLNVQASGTPDSCLEWKEIQLQLQRTVDQLPPQCRTVFKLVKEEGMKIAQVAKILNISPRTVETQLYRATKRLLQQLVEHKQQPHKKPEKNTGKL